MPGLAGHPRLYCCAEDVDARDKRGHEGHASIVTVTGT
jgi:hypothetical protein